jgi:hypothetical protein
MPNILFSETISGTDGLEPLQEVGSSNMKQATHDDDATGAAGAGAMIAVPMAVNRERATNEPFPRKLYELLEQTDPSVIAWLADGARRHPAVASN